MNLNFSYFRPSCDPIRSHALCGKLPLLLPGILLIYPWSRASRQRCRDRRRDHGAGCPSSTSSTTCCRPPFRPSSSLKARHPPGTPLEQRSSKQVERVYGSDSESRRSRRKGRRCPSAAHERLGWARVGHGWVGNGLGRAPICARACLPMTVGTARAMNIARMLVPRISLCSSLRSASLGVVARGTTWLCALC